MPTYRIERTEMLARVWYIDAETEDAALERYIEEEEETRETTIFGHPTVVIDEVD